MLTGTGALVGVVALGPIRFKAFPVNVYEDPPTSPLTCMLVVAEDKTCPSDELAL